MMKKRTVQKILFLINGTDYGGTELALYGIACGLRERGYGVHVVSIKPVGRIGFRLRKENITVSSLKMAEFPAFNQILSGCWKLAKWIRIQRFDVIHSFLPRANIMSRIALFLSGLRIMHISSERSTDFNRRWVVRLLNFLTVPLTDCVLAVSPIIRDILIEREHIPARKISILENGINLKTIDNYPAFDIRKELDLRSESVLLCSVGRLVADKGHLYLLRAIKQMRCKTEVDLALIGDGPEELKLRAEAVRCGISDRVHFLGFRPDVLEVLKSVNVFVLPSLEEGCPVVLLEAMACSLPVIATAVGGVPDLVIPGETGLLVPPAEIWNSNDRDKKLGGNPNGESGQDEPSKTRGISALAAALDELVSNPDQIVRLGKSGRRRLEQYYTLDAVLTRLEHLYTHGKLGSRVSTCETEKVETLPLEV